MHEKLFKIAIDLINIGALKDVDSILKQVKSRCASCESVMIKHGGKWICKKCQKPKAPKIIEKTASKESVVDYVMANLDTSWSKKLIHEARNWIADCQWGESDEDPDFYKDLTPFQVMRGINKFYDGGITQFIKDNNMQFWDKNPHKEFMFSAEAEDYE